LSFSYPLPFLFAHRPAILGQECGIVYRVIAGHLIEKAGFISRTARTDAVMLMMCLDARMPQSAWMREIGPALRHSRQQVEQAGKMPLAVTRPGSSIR
jgi:hypothetical protein